LAAPDEHFLGSSRDHIVPGAGDGLDNLALACRACNFIKRNKHFDIPGQILKREELITRAREYIHAEREKKKVRLAHSRDLLIICGLVRKPPAA